MLIFKQRLIGLNSEFSFCYTGCHIEAEDSSLPFYLPVAGGIKRGFMPKLKTQSAHGKKTIGFLSIVRVLLLCEMQAASLSINTKTKPGQNPWNKQLDPSPSFGYY